MNIIITEECYSCRYWNNIEITRRGIGHCRRFPPTIAPVSPPYPPYTYPVTVDYFWCGEYQWDNETVEDPI